LSHGTVSRPIRSELRRAGIVLAFLAPLLIASCPEPIWFEAPHPAQDNCGKIEDKLDGQTSSPPTQEVLLAIFEFPETAGDKGELSLSMPESAALPRFGLIQDLNGVLDAPGLYLGVQDANQVFVHLIRLGDPRIIRSEREQAGKLQPDFIHDRGGVIAARIPFAPDGRLRIFEVAGGAVTVLHLDAPLGPAPFPERGWPGWL